MEWFRFQVGDWCFLCKWHSTTIYCSIFLRETFLRYFILFFFIITSCIILLPDLLNFGALVLNLCVHDFHPIYSLCMIVAIIEYKGFVSHCKHKTDLNTNKFCLVFEHTIYFIMLVKNPDENKKNENKEDEVWYENGKQTVQCLNELWVEDFVVTRNLNCPILLRTI